jgi:hypothetical protein
MTVRSASGGSSFPDHPKRYLSDRMRAIGAASLAVEHGNVLAVVELGCSPHRAKPIQGSDIMTERYGKQYR